MTGVREGQARLWGQGLERDREPDPWEGDRQGTRGP